MEGRCMVWEYDIQFCMSEEKADFLMEASTVHTDSEWKEES